MANKSNKIQYVLLIQLIKVVLLHYLWINNVDNAVKKRLQDCLLAISQTGPSLWFMEGGET